MRRLLPTLFVAAALGCGAPASAAPIDDRPAGEAYAAFDRMARESADDALPRLSTDRGRAVLLGVWNGVALETGRPFDAFDTERLRRICSYGQMVLVRYFDADETAAAASRPPDQRYWLEILEGVDFAIRCAAGLLQAHTALAARYLPGIAYDEARQSWGHLRAQLLDQFNMPLRAIGAGALAGEALDRMAVAFRESAGRVAGMLPQAERDALVALARQAAARAEPLARADLEFFADTVAGR
ncbi:hypothetical protein [Phreatobacter sp.]|uniref:hypothetical protein n=1 Tax=Phreatobacter sp. TaxID=1966341 RepID=UPI003F70276D